MSLGSEEKVPGRARYYGDPNKLDQNLRQSELFEPPGCSTKDASRTEDPSRTRAMSIDEPGVACEGSGDTSGTAASSGSSHANIAGGRMRRRSSSSDIDTLSQRVQQTNDRRGHLDRLDFEGPFHSWHGTEGLGGVDSVEAGSSHRQRRAVSELSEETSSQKRQRHQKSRKPSPLPASADPVSDRSYGHKDQHKQAEGRVLTYCPYTAVGEEANERYQSDGKGYPEHDREDRHYAIVYKEFSVYGVFDGHDGSTASEFANNHFRDLSIQWCKGNRVHTHEQIQDALVSIFKDVEQQFFAMLEPHILEKFQLQSLLPEDMKSYDAYQLYPDVVNKLSAVCEKLAGGTTAAVAVICNDVLHVANVGDSRVLLAYNEPETSPDLYCRQLTVDHDCGNKDELKRLEGLGLNAKAIVKSGRIGSQQCTRTLGDYSVKGGYQEFDILRDARSEPVIADPFVSEGVDLEKKHQFIAIMSDGVYKTYIEATDDTDGANCAICRMIHAELNMGSSGIQKVAKRVIKRLIQMHKEAYFDNGRQECRKRDDMTLIVRSLQTIQTSL